MKKWIWLFAIVLAACAGKQSGSDSTESDVQAASASQGPKLVVGLVIDQMRQDYLTRYSEKYVDNGFKRMLNEGFMFSDAHFNYIPTYTGPGHAAVYTGATPSANGVIANNWFDRVSGKSVYCVDDQNHPIVGGEGPGKSPNRLRSSTVTDELRKASPESKVVSISIKDRGAVLPGGKEANAAYWYDYETGRFVTSDFYSAEMPEWVTQFNDQDLASQYMTKPWETLLNIQDYTESISDANPYEIPYQGEDAPIFPHDLPQLFEAAGHHLLPYTPFGNTYTLDFARQALMEEQLGQGEHTDFLAVSMSSTDKVGHQFGPQSIEMEDTYLRLDRDLAAFMEFLDEKVGKGQYLLFLTADHGVVDVPAYLMDQQQTGGYLDPGELRKALDEAMMQEYGKEGLILNMSNNQVFLDASVVEEAELNLTAVASKLRSVALDQEGIAEAFTAEELKTAEPESKQGKLIYNGFHAEMSGDLALVLEEGWLATTNKRGTSHGSGYRYDTHVPMLWFGWNVSNGTSDQPVTVTQIAPTVSDMLGIQKPDGSKADPLTQILKPKQ